MRAHRDTPRQVLAEKVLAAVRPGQAFAQVDQVAGIDRQRMIAAARLDDALANFRSVLGIPALLARLHRAIREF